MAERAEENYRTLADVEGDSIWISFGNSGTFRQVKVCGMSPSPRTQLSQMAIYQLQNTCSVVADNILLPLTNGLHEDRDSGGSLDAMEVSILDNSLSLLDDIKDSDLNQGWTQDEPMDSSQDHNVPSLVNEIYDHPTKEFGNLALNEVSFLSYRQSNITTAFHFF